MSKYTHITKDGMILEVGYDSPMDYVFVQVLKNNDYLYSNINDCEINFTHQIDFAYFDTKMKELGIEIPEELKVKVLTDRANYIGNLESFPGQIIASLNEEVENGIVIFQNPFFENTKYESFEKKSEALTRMNQINGACIDDWEDL